MELLRHCQAENDPRNCCSEGVLKCELLGGSSVDLPEVWKMHLSALQAVSHDKCTHLLLPFPPQSWEHNITQGSDTENFKDWASQWKSSNEIKDTFSTPLLYQYLSLWVNQNKMFKRKNNEICPLSEIQGIVHTSSCFQLYFFGCKNILSQEKSLSRAVQQKFFLLTALTAHETSQAAPFQDITLKMVYKAPWDKNNSSSTHCVSTELQISTGSLN